MASTISDIEKIHVTLSETDVVIEPGSVAQVVVTMTNRQDTPDRLSLEVEGVDVEWYAIPVNAVNVAPGAQVSERILFKVARSSENRAGSYPFLVRVQAMETGEVGVAQATLIVKPFSSLQVELNPKRGVATYLRPVNEFDVTVSNLGNDEETLDLNATDPEDGCAYEFDQDRITLKAGQSAVVPLLMRPKVSSMLGGMRLYGFNVIARSNEDAYVTANAHGQLEKRALISPLLGIFLLLLGLVGGIAYYLRPQPPAPILINGFASSASRVEYNQPITLSWDVAPGFKQILIKYRVGKDGSELALPGDMHNPVGAISVTPQPPQTTYMLIVRGFGSQPEKKKELTIVAGWPPKPAPPRIKFFRANPAKVHVGETVMLEWDTTGAKEHILDPGSIKLSQFEMTHPVVPDQDTTFTLRVRGADDSVPPATKSVKVTVVPKEVCIAEIEGFRATSSTVYIGDKVKLRWKTAYARTVRIDSDHGPVGVVANPLSGSLEVPFPITEPTTFTLTAADSQEKTVTRTLTVTPKPRPAPPVPPTQPGDLTTPPDTKTNPNGGTTP